MDQSTIINGANRSPHECKKRSNFVSNFENELFTKAEAISTVDETKKIPTYVERNINKETAKKKQLKRRGTNMIFFVQNQQQV